MLSVARKERLRLDTLSGAVLMPGFVKSCNLLIRHLVRFQHSDSLLPFHLLKNVPHAFELEKQEALRPESLASDTYAYGRIV